VSQKSKSTFVLTDPSEILAALVGLKDVRVVRYKRTGPAVELVVEQVVDEVRCPACAGAAVVHDCA
jgi:transposase